MMSDWQPIATAPVKQEVLLAWNYDAAPIIRIGSIMWAPFRNERPTIKLEMDIGDASAMFFMPKADAPTHWMPLPTPPERGE